VNFGDIDAFVFFGGGPLLPEAAERMAADGCRVAVFTSPRHLGEEVAAGVTLEGALERADIPTFEVKDVNDEPRLAEHVSGSTLGVALGPAWIFGAGVCALFGERFVNFMGIDLPRYRGGAHHTWQILQGNRIGAVNMQLINDVVDSGAIVKHGQFLYPADARVPADYFAAAEPVSREFLLEFLDEVRAGADFVEQPIQEKLAQHFPYLSTDDQGWVDWSWHVEEVTRFVNAFGDPYRGASTVYEGERVRLLGARMETGDGPFHPFMAGLVYRVTADAAWVCARGGSLVLQRIVAEDGTDVEVRVGRRLHTPRETLERALRFRAVYTGAGLKEAGT
jgi:methionyl-tRNA formyltransferase